MPGAKLAPFSDGIYTRSEQRPLLTAEAPGMTKDSADRLMRVNMYMRPLGFILYHSMALVREPMRVTAACMQARRAARRSCLAARRVLTATLNARAHPAPLLPCMCAPPACSWRPSCSRGATWPSASWATCSQTWSASACATTGCSHTAASSAPSSWCAQRVLRACARVVPHEAAHCAGGGSARRLCRTTCGPAACRPPPAHRACRAPCRHTPPSCCPPAGVCHGLVGLYGGAGRPH